MAHTGVFMALLALLALSLLAGISVGSTSIAPVIVAKVLAAKILPHGWIDTGISEAESVVVWLIRTPRVLVAGLVGAGLALAGVQMYTTIILGLARYPRHQHRCCVRCGAGQPAAWQRVRLCMCHC